jgi:hypothetical protein
MEMFGSNNLKKGAEVTSGEYSQLGVAETTGDAASTALEENERGCTVRLFGTNSLKEGAV